MNDLVQRLAAEQAVEVSLVPERTALALKHRINDHGYVHLKFTATRDGTEVGHEPM